ncbi:hypothetical protein M899_0302 [Bacteriovorax sp. BSW11_IV]|uniref:hypothetical protein n=1 Tax=Bacteriovorax sp. BSW11_IV TaxID=1353529 RepID=UPI00038A07C8|nr:hypothetical protein [Bacteriovorax sp. BSW11_IV]EQC50284.1 hypothetical protein M899_0302 [Bacteriovorax sp. BSW11_IV]
MANLKNDKPFKRFLHNLVCYSTSVGLLLPVTFVDALAQQKVETYTQQGGPSAIESGMQMFNQFTQQAAQQILQVRQQAMQAQMNASMMQSLGAPKPTPAKYFNDPNFHFCYVAPSKSSFPEGVCSSINSPQEFNQSEIYRQYAHTQLEFYDQLITQGQNSAFPKGVQCLKEGQKKLEAEFQNKFNSLQALADSIKKDLQMFREQNKQIKEKMSDLNTELTGGKANSVEDKAKDLASYFSNECKNIIGPDILAKSKTNGGLIGVKDSMSGNVQAATNFTANSVAYGKKLEKNIQDIRTQITDYGLSSLNENSFDGPFKAKLQKIFAKEAQKIQSVYKAASDEISKLGSKNKYKLPNLDKNFKVNLATFEKNATEALRREYIRDCVTGAENGVGISLDQLLASLRYTGTGDGTGAVNSIRIQVQNIINNQNITMEEKLNQLQAIESNDNKDSVVFTYTGNEGSPTAANPYEYFKQATAACDSKYESDKSDETLSTQKQKIDHVKAYLTDLKNLEKEFLPNLTRVAAKEIMSCNGNDLQTDTCDKDGKIFNPSSESFCISHATLCTQKVNSCFTQADKIVKTKKAELDKYAAQYNMNARTLITMQQAKLNQIKQKVLADANFIQKYFTGAKFEMPGDFFVKMPEMGLAKDLGVDLLGGGNLDDLEKLPEIIETKIIKMLANQASEAINNVDEYIVAQQKNLEHNRSKWSSLADNCSNQMDNFSNTMAKQASEAQQKQQEAQGEVNDYCNKLKFVAANHPNAACDMSNGPMKLSDDVSKVMSAGLNPEMQYLNSELNAICNSYGNEKNTDSDSKSKTPTIIRLCQDNDNDWGSAKESAAQAIAANTPLDDEQRDALIKFITEGGDVPSGIDDEELLKNLKSIRAKIEEAESIKTANGEEPLKNISIENWSTIKARILEESGLSESAKYEAGDVCKNMELDTKISIIRGLSGESAKEAAKDYNEQYEKKMENVPAKYKSLARLIDKPVSNSRYSQWQKVGERVNSIGCFAGNDMQRGFGAFGEAGQGIADIFNSMGHSR